MLCRRRSFNTQSSAAWDERTEQGYATNNEECQMAYGFRVYTKRSLPAASIVEQFRTIPVSNIGDSINRLGIMHERLRLFSKPGANMAGVALTVTAREGDNLMMHKALNMAEKGDIIVVANGGRNRSLAGEIMVAYAAGKGVAGIVIDGPIRDCATIADMDIPVYATGVTPRGPYKAGPGEVNVPVSCCGVAVNPGDILVGDPDGVIVIPAEDEEIILRLAQDFQKKDAAKYEAAKAGKADRSWVDKELAGLGCEIIDGMCPQ